MGQRSFAGAGSRPRQPLGQISPQTDPAFEVQGQHLPRADW
jgi:hypothetical protein